MEPILWRPSEEAIRSSSITKLIETVNLRYSARVSNYAELHKWSIDNLDEFWSLVWDQCGIIGDKAEHIFLQAPYLPEARFFPDAKLNVAENLLSRGDDAEIAIIAVAEDGADKTLTFGQLRAEVAACAAALRSSGITSGDRVAAWIPNNPEAVILALAALSIGAIVSTASPDFAPSAVADRFGQIEPKLLVAAASYSYGGKKFDCVDRLGEIVKLLPSITKVVLIEDDRSATKFEGWRAWLAPHRGAPLEFTALPFDHPGFVLFSSGTTGKPKCITHRAAGILLKLRAEQRYQLELSEKDRTLFYTTCGWMMWNWLLYLLGSGSSIVLYDGSPAYPEIDRLFELAARYEVTALGISAKYADSLRKGDLRLKDRHDLSKLRIIMSTGSVLAPESFDYLYQETKPDLHLVSFSGGTDICGCFLIGVPTEPVHRGELQGPALGLAMNVYRDDGTPAPVGEKGELVCEQPFPSMPIGFWGDNDGSRYRAAYFQGFPGVWTHGDFAAKSETGGYVMFGRSDATLNSKGIRIGTAEIYRVVESFIEISEAMAVSQDWDGDTRVVLFLVMSRDYELTNDLRNRLKTALRNHASPKHIPDLILTAPELPRTKSNKLVELAVTDVINGREVRNRDALANPAALDWFENRPELK